MRADLLHIWQYLDMNHIFRLVYLLLTAPFKKKIEFNSTTTTSFRVWFTDLDILMHMNNGIYLSLLDLGRVDFMIKTGGFKKVNKKGMYPVVASEGIKFKRSLRLFQKFEIKTRLAGWDDKFVYLEQSFWSKDRLHASAIIKGKFLKKSGEKVDSAELIEVMGYKGDLRPKPYIQGFSESMDGAFNDHELKQI